MLDCTSAAFVRFKEKIQVPRRLCLYKFLIFSRTVRPGSQSYSGAGCEAVQNQITTYNLNANVFVLKNDTIIMEQILVK